MAPAQIGIFTTVLETSATTVGAGMLLGGFAAGAAGAFAGQRRPELEANALNHGYFGGIAGALLALVDLAIRYGG